MTGHHVRPWYEGHQAVDQAPSKSPWKKKSVSGLVSSCYHTFEAHDKLCVLLRHLCIFSITYPGEHTIARHVLQTCGADESFAKQHSLWPTGFQGRRQGGLPRLGVS